jgi:hypothetical protein
MAASAPAIVGGSVVSSVIGADVGDEAQADYAIARELIDGLLPSKAKYDLIFRISNKHHIEAQATQPLMSNWFANATWNVSTI